MPQYIHIRIHMHILAVSFVPCRRYSVRYVRKLDTYKILPNHKYIHTICTHVHMHIYTSYMHYLLCEIYSFSSQTYVIYQLQIVISQHYYSKRCKLLNKFQELFDQIIVAEIYFPRNQLQQVAEVANSTSMSLG